MLAFYSWFCFLLVLPSCAASLNNTVLSAFGNTTDCESCHALLVLLKGLALLSDAAFVDSFVSLCKSYKLQDDDVCQGTITQQGPIIAHDLRQISTSGKTATLLCDALFGLCQAPAVNQYSVPFPSPAPANPKIWKSSGRPTFQVMHFSDVHIDREYTPGSEANCTKPICCRNFADNTNAPTLPAGPNGNHKCDSPVSLTDSMLEFAQQIGSGAKFSVFTGDVVEADVWLANKSEVTTDLQDFNNEMAARLQAPVFPCFGNHDIAPTNLFRRNTTSTASNDQWVFDTQSANWARWLNSDATSQVKHESGSYSALISGMDLRLIVLNTQYWYKENFWLYDSDQPQADPNGVLAFLVEALQATEDAGQRAWISGHISPGHLDMMHDQSNYYDQIIQRYKNSISGQVFGHSHRDQFEVGYSDYNNQTAATATTFASLAPALTPRSGNPAFKMYDVDSETFEIMDVKVYTTNMSDPTFQSTPTWKLYYSARDTYGPLVNLSSGDSLNAAFWHNLTEVFVSNDTAFQMYQTFLSRDGAVGACNATCKETTICGLRAMRAENDCNLVTPGLPIGRRNVAESTNSSQAYDVSCGRGFSYIMQKLRVQLSSSSNAAS